MADAIGIYKYLWRPEELGITKAHQLISPLSKGLRTMLDNPDMFIAMNPSNGWGSYDGLKSFVERYLIACSTYPEADVEANR